MAMAAATSRYKVVVGIDFGTTYSGYAYSFTDSKDDIKTNRNWSDKLGYQVRIFSQACWCINFFTILCIPHTPINYSNP